MSEQNAAYQSLGQRPVQAVGECRQKAGRSAPRLDTSAERDFDELTQLAAQLCRAPLALIVIAHGAGRWAKSAFGLRREDAPVQFALCEATLGQEEPFVVVDTLVNECFSANPLVAAGVSCRSYVGVRLVSQQGIVLGVLCVMDVQPHEWYAMEAEALQMLARQVVAQIELRRAEAELTRSGEQLERSLREGERTTLALSESEARFHSMADSAPVMIWTAGPYATPTFFNRSWLDFIGQSLAQALKGGWRESVHPNDLPGYLDSYVSAFKAQRSFRVAYRLRRADGTYRWVEDAGVPWFVNGGTFSGFVGAAFDITEHRQHEDQIETLNRALEERVNERTAELRAANQELENFAHSISHDLRTPLRAISGFSRILLESHAAGLNAEAVRCLKLVTRGALQMNRLIDDLLQFARFSRLPLMKRTMEPGGLAESVIAQLREAHPERRLTFKLEVLPACDGDPALLRQVFSNLLDNSVKFTRDQETPVIEIGWQPSSTSDGQVIYFVRDNGTGFDMRYAHKLFGVFQRLHRADEYEGTGVGLSIVQQIIQRHGGTIWAQAEPGQGATIYFTIPGAVGNPELVPSPKARSGTAAGGTSSRGI